MTTDITRIVLLVLAIAFLASLAGIAILTGFERPVPDILPQLVRDIIIAFLGLLAPRPGTQDVNVVNKPADPVPVDPA